MFSSIVATQPGQLEHVALVLHVIQEIWDQPVVVWLRDHSTAHCKHCPMLYFLRGPQPLLPPQAHSGVVLLNLKNLQKKIKALLV